MSDFIGDKEGITDQPSQLSDGQIVADTHEPHLSPSSDTLSQSRSPHWTLDSADGHILDIQSSSKPAISSHPLHSAPDSFEQQFVQLVDADGDLDRVSSLDAENNLNKKNADLKESSAKNVDSHHLFVEDNKVHNDLVAGIETVQQYKEMEFDGDEYNEEDDDNDSDEEDGNDEVEQADVDDDDEDDAADNVDDNADVDARNDGVDVTVDKHLEKVKDASARDLNQPAHPTAGVSELGNSAVDTEATVESAFSGPTKGQHFQPLAQKPAVSSGHVQSEQYSGPRSDASVRQLRSPEVDQLSHSGHVGNDFGQQQADIIGHRGHWRQHYQPGDVVFPGEFQQRMNHGAHPSVVWKYVQSSPVEEFHNKWPEMQEAYRSWPESLADRQYDMNHMTDDYNFMQHDQKQFVNYQFDKRWPHVHPQDDYYLHNQRDRSNRFSGQIPNVVIRQWPDEDARRHVHYGDMFTNQQHQEPDIHQPNIRIDQVYRQQPLSQSYMRRFDEKAPQSGVADESVSSVHSSEQAAGQTENSAVDQPQRPPADKSHVDQRPSSAQWAERDQLLTEQTDDPQYYRDAHVSSSSQKYADDASQLPSPVLGRSSDHISGV